MTEKTQTAILIALIVTFLAFGLFGYDKATKRKLAYTCNDRAEKLETMQDYYITSYELAECKSINVTFQNIKECNKKYYRYNGGNFHCE